MSKLNPHVLSAESWKTWRGHILLILLMCPWNVYNGKWTKGPLSNRIGFERQTLRVPINIQHPPLSPVPLLSVWKWERKAVFLHQQKANHKHLSVVLLKQNMTSEKVELSLTLYVKFRSAIHPATRLISITKMSPLLYPRCLSLGRRSSHIHRPLHHRH